jgi:hypothetical protein
LDINNFVIKKEKKVKKIAAQTGNYLKEYNAVTAGISGL